jgi:hypothetical protein
MPSETLDDRIRNRMTEINQSIDFMMKERDELLHALRAIERILESGVPAIATEKQLKIEAEPPPQPESPASTEMSEPDGIEAALAALESRAFSAKS